jgi:TPR repeat protein
MKLAYVYGEGRGGTPTDYTEAYKWYDIAAATVGARIDKLPVAASYNGEKDNSDQLGYRD